MTTAHARTPTLVADTVDALDLSDAFETRATAIATRAEPEHPINRAPSTIAAAAVYLVSLLEGPRLTQPEVAEASDACAVAIRNCYPELAAAEGIDLVRKPGSFPNAEVEQ